MFWNLERLNREVWLLKARVNNLIGGLTFVSHDGSLSGDGTPGDPLSVVGGSGSFPITAGEDLSPTNLSYIASDGLCYKASASSEVSECTCIVNDTILTGNTGVAYYPSLVIGGFTVVSGRRYFLSEIPGELTLVIPTTQASIVQQIGTAISNTEILFDPKGIIKREDDSLFLVTEDLLSIITEDGLFIELDEPLTLITESLDAIIVESGETLIT
jgi:hypothetical protein